MPDIRPVYQLCTYNESGPFLALQIIPGDVLQNRSSVISLQLIVFKAMISSSGACQCVHENNLSTCIMYHTPPERKLVSYGCGTM